MSKSKLLLVALAVMVCRGYGGKAEGDQHTEEVHGGALLQPLLVSAWKAQAMKLVGEQSVVRMSILLWTLSPSSCESENGSRTRGAGEKSVLARDVGIGFAVGNTSSVLRFSTVVGKFEKKVGGVRWCLCVYMRVY